MNLGSGIQIGRASNSVTSGAAIELIINAFKAIDQSAEDGQFTPVQFDSILAGGTQTSDLGVTWTLQPGKYLVMACVGFGQIAAETTLQCLVSLFMNGSELARLGRQYFTATDGWHQTLIGMHGIEVSEESEIYIAAYQDKSGVSQPISTDSFTTWLQVYKFS